VLTNPTYTGRELENKLTSIGYSKMMTESIPLNIALGRVMPSTDGGATYERVYIRSIFGAMAKHPFPVANLLSAARRANMYQPPAGDKHSLLMVPPGMLEIAHYTRPDSMQYSVSGFKQSEQKRMYLDMPGAFLEPQLGVKVVVCKRPPDYSHGMAHGRVLNEGHLNTIADWATVYEIPAAAGTEQYGIVDHEFGNIKPVADDTKYYRPSMRAMMGSALLVADPGPNTGEMLFAYPSTTVATDRANETMKCQLRVYMGAAIYKPDNILRFDHVSFEGLVDGHTFGDAKEFTNAGVVLSLNVFDAATSALTFTIANPDELARTKAVVGTNGGTNPFSIFGAGGGAYDDAVLAKCAVTFAANKITFTGAGIADFVGIKLVVREPDTRAWYALNGNVGLPGHVKSKNKESWLAQKVYKGAVYMRGSSGQAWVPYCANEGHLGVLDDPAFTDRLHGMHVYSGAPA
jgi:hypothetical protein